jgi:hypothetical protein
VDALAAEVHALLMPSLSCGQEHGSSNGTEQNKLSNGVISTDCGAAVDQQCSSDAGSPPLNVIGTEAGGTFGTSSNGASELGIRLPHSFLARLVTELLLSAICGLPITALLLCAMWV